LNAGEQRLSSVVAVLATALLPALLLIGLMLSALDVAAMAVLTAFAASLGSEFVILRETAFFTRDASPALARGVALFILIHRSKAAVRRMRLVAIRHCYLYACCHYSTTPRN